ncbi:MAG: hypothetical protein LBD06_09825, partial [Candidatus Accumulibacter sp.]|nr:hypothetical protein [Accumulibacter sp.]
PMDKNWLAALRAGGWRGNQVLGVRGQWTEDRRQKTEDREPERSVFPFRIRREAPQADLSSVPCLLKYSVPE